MIYSRWLSKDIGGADYDDNDDDRQREQQTEKVCLAVEITFVATRRPQRPAACTFCARSGRPQRQLGHLAATLGAKISS